MAAGDIKGYREESNGSFTEINLNDYYSNTSNGIVTDKFPITYDDLRNNYLQDGIELVNLGSGWWIDLISVMVYRPDLIGGYSGGVDITIKVGSGAICTIPGADVITNNTHAGTYKAAITEGACGPAIILAQSNGNYDEGNVSNEPFLLVIAYRKFQP